MSQDNIQPKQPFNPEQEKLDYESYEKDKNSNKYAQAKERKIKTKVLKK